MPRQLNRAVAIACALVLGACGSSTGERPPDMPADGRRLGPDRIEQAAIPNMPLDDVRNAGLQVFATPFTAADGFGDGPMDPDDPVTPGGRPTLQGNGMFLRVNGLDGQACLECHSIVSAATVPATFGVGGVGGSVANAMFQPTSIDVGDTVGSGFAAFDGRFINPPFLFGSGGIELLAAEMTMDLQRLADRAAMQPGTDVPLITKGVDFGVVRFVDGALDTSDVAGVDADLIVRPFGRKGEFPSVRAFDLEAMPFHFGMQPVEKVGEGNDADGDGVVDEVMPGEISALHIFNTTLDRPVVEPLPRFDEGMEVFARVGCTECHRPELTTESRYLVYSYPEVIDDPWANEFLRIDLTESPPGFEPSERGISVPLFADLRRHDMGDDLAESFGSPLDHLFTTARLWGVADTAPYLHDGRATTLREAILMHGGEAEPPRDAFSGLDPDDQDALIEMLRSLRTPIDPAGDLTP